jgi:hypothetical protein
MTQSLEHTAECQWLTGLDSWVLFYLIGTWDADLKVMVLIQMLKE